MLSILQMKDISILQMQMETFQRLKEVLNQVKVIVTTMLRGLLEKIMVDYQLMMGALNSKYI